MTVSVPAEAPVQNSRLLPIPMVLAGALSAALAAGAAHARPPEQEPDNLLNDRFGLQFALMHSSSSTDVRVDATDGTLGTELNAEDDLGLSKTKLLGRGEVWFRMRERHRVRISNYFVPLDRRGDAVLDRTIQFGDETYFVNESVSSRLAVRVLAFTYTYSFVKNDRIEAGASLGFDVVGFEGEATVPARLRTEREERSGPAPLVGFDVTGRIRGPWYAEARMLYVKANVGDVEGSLTAFEVNGLYRLHRNITLGLGYNSFDVDIDSRDSGDSGRLKLSTAGPQLFARVGF
jgi:hypothetical protein